MIGKIFVLALVAFFLWGYTTTLAAKLGGSKFRCPAEWPSLARFLRFPKPPFCLRLAVGVMKSRI
jgi:hypothetical protein